MVTNDISGLGKGPAGILYNAGNIVSGSGALVCGSLHVQARGLSLATLLVAPMLIPLGLAVVAIGLFPVFLPPYSPELQPAEHLWPLTNAALVNQHFATIEDLEDAQFVRCAALQRQRARIRSTTLFHWWPKQIHKRRGPRRN